MSYALALGLDQSIVDHLKQIGPKCWSGDMAQCSDGENTSYPNCAEINKISKDHPDEYSTWTDSVPWCPQALEKNYTVLSPGYVGLVEAAFVGAVVGVALVHLLS